MKKKQRGFYTGHEEDEYIPQHLIIRGRATLPAAPLLRVLLLGRTGRQQRSQQVPFRLLLRRAPGLDSCLLQRDELPHVPLEFRKGSVCDFPRGSPEQSFG